jgi:hypothetical protein
MRFFIKNISKNSLIAQILIFSLCAYILFAGYLDLLPKYELYNEKRIFQVVLLGIISIASLLFFPRDIAATLKQLSPLSKNLILAVLILGVISAAIHNTHYQKSLLELGLYGLLFMSVLSAATIYHPLRHQFHNIILTCLLITAYLHMTIVVTGYIASFTFDELSLRPLELFLNFSHARFFNQLQSWTLPLIVLPVICWQYKKSYYRAFTIFASIGWWWLLFVSGGRGTLLGISVALVLTTLIYKTRAKLWLKWQLISASVGLLLYLLLFYLIPTIIVASSKTMSSFSALRDTGSSGRDYIWLNSWKLLQNDLLLGIGPGMFACSFANYSPPLPAHPHNSLIQIATEWGLPAALIVTILFIWGSWSWIKKDTLNPVTEGNTNEQLISMSLFASLISASIHSLFSGIIIMPHSQVMMVIILGWMLGIYFQSSKQSTHSPTVNTIGNSRRTIIILVLLTLASLISLLVGMYHALSIINLDEAHMILLPRFWQQGLYCD